MRAAGGAASMHAAYEEEDERVLEHAGEEELACHCRLRPRGGGAHGGCRGGSRVARASSPQTGCGRGIYLRDLECHVDPAI